MKKLLLTLLASVVLNAHADTNDVGVMTFNIRCGSCEKTTDVNHWSRRQLLVEDLIRHDHPDLIGLQEAELFQVRDLKAALDEYGAIAVGRDDGKEQGEATAIFYRKARFELIEEATYWLSPTPETVSVGWDAALKRTVTMAKLKDRLSGQVLVMLNTHFDHRGRVAQTESTRMLVKLAASFAGKIPVIVTGDFNYTKTFPAYSIIATSLHDAEQVSLSPAQGGDMSFQGFGTAIEPGNKIDFVFVNDHVDVLSHAIVKTMYDGLYPSDHFPVEAKVRLK